MLNHVAQGQPCQTIPLNIARYRKAVYSALWVDTGNIGSLLSATRYNVYFSSSKRDLFIRSPCSSLDSYFSLFELILKPFTVLLEDQRSKASCKRKIKASLLLIELVFFAFQPVIHPWKTCFQGEILPCWYRTIFNCKYIVLQAYLTEFKGISPSCFFLGTSISFLA